MQALGFAERLAQKLAGAAQETPGILRLVDEIGGTEQQLHKLKGRLDQVTGQISRWDRINILTKTPAEREEEELRRSIASQEQKLKELHTQLDQRLMELFLHLTRRDGEFLHLRLWDLVRKLRQQIEGLRIDYGLLGWGDFFDQMDDKIRGREKCLATITQLEEALLPSDPEVTVSTVLALAKSALLGEGGEKAYPL